MLSCETTERGGRIGRATIEPLISGEALRLECDLEVSAALLHMAREGVTSAPVVDDNNVLVGMVFSTALAKLPQNAGYEVEDAMQGSFLALDSCASLDETARLLATHRLDRAPVVSERGVLVGVVHGVDVLRAML